MSYYPLISIMPKAAAYDSDAQAFITAAAITDVTQQGAINTLVLALKGYSIWTKFKAIYPIVGGTASQHKFNLKDPRDLDAAFRLTFASGVTHSSTGMVSNGTSGFANTYFNPTTGFTVNDDVHLSFYSRTNLNTSQVEIGSAIATYGPYLLLEIRTSGTTYFIINESAVYTNGADTDSRAFYIGTKNGTTTKGYRNSVNIATRTIGALTRPNFNIYLLCFNANNVASLYSTKQCAFASIGDGLTPTEAANFYTAVQAYQTTLSRQV
jgi:hypothetical protein